METPEIPLESAPASSRTDAPGGRKAPKWLDEWLECPPLDVHALTAAIMQRLVGAMRSDFECCQCGSRQIRLPIRGKLLSETVEQLVMGYDAMRTEHLRFLKGELRRMYERAPAPRIILTTSRQVADKLREAMGCPTAPEKIEEISSRELLASVAPYPTTAEVIADAVAAERRRCAEIVVMVQDGANGYENAEASGMDIACDEILQAINAATTSPAGH